MEVADLVSVLVHAEAPARLAPDTERCVLSWKQGGHELLSEWCLCWPGSS